MAVLVTTRLLPIFKSNRFMPCPQLIVSCPALDRWPWRRYYISSGVLDRSPHRAHASPAFSLFLNRLPLAERSPERIDK